jgi:hypothetical protein
MNLQQVCKKTSLTSPERQRRVSSTRRWRSGLVVLLLLLPAAAQAQGERNEPYNLHIVVHVAENRLLTEVFRERIERELRDGFQAGLGDMGHVTVSHDHPRLPDVLARGLKLSLDSWTDRTDVKTHFVLIDYSGVHYEIQTRQYDGSIGRASPVVRHDRTRDRAFVAKAAALLIKQDFGILGTVLTDPEGQKEEVKVELRGGALGDLSRWVKEGEVFALAPPGGGSLDSLKWSLLQVDKAPTENARDGLCLCRFFHRYRVGSIAGFRCIKLGTVRAPLRLRWLKVVPGSKAPPKPLDGPLTVEVRHHGFTGEEANRLETLIKRGVLETVHDGEKGIFDNAAFVRVTSGIPDSQPQVPIALVDDQPIFIEVTMRKEEDALFSVQLSSWRSTVADSLYQQANLFKRLETLGAKAENRQDIIQEAERGLSSLRDSRARLIREKETIVKEAQDQNIPLKTQREDNQLAELASAEQALQRFIAEQKKIEDTENDPQRKKWLSEIQNAKLLEKELEYGKALEIYERIQKEGFADAELDAHIKDLRKVWKAGDAELEEARGFIYRVWPTLDTSRLEEGISKAEEAFKKCKEAGDRISIQKLLKGTERHADRLAKELSELRPDIISDDVAPAKKLQKTSEKLLKLFTDIQDYQKALLPEK